MDRQEGDASPREGDRRKSAGRRRNDEPGGVDESVKPKGSGPEDKNPGDAGETEKPKNPWRKPLLIAGGIVILALLIVGGVLYWLHARHFESTDDAFVDTHIVRLAPQIAGRVTGVLVNDNQLVQANQALVTIDSAEMQTRGVQAEAQKAQAQSQLDNARVQIDLAQANYQQALADAGAAQAQADDAARDLARYRSLEKLNPAAVAQQQLDQAETKARQTAAQRDSAQKAAKSRSDQIAAARTQAASAQDQLRAAQSQLDEADINLGYDNLVAPVAGHVAQMSVAVGNYVQPGTELLAIVPLDLWVTANFEETQLALMRIGQKVSLSIDACPDAPADGHVDSIEHGAGQAFGILPPENATGNFVKVTQRVPVKILFDHLPQDCPLGPGMSVEPTVTVR